MSKRSFRVDTTAAAIECSFKVTNTGSRDGDEVVLLFVQPQNGTIIPGANDTLARKVLVGFERVTIQAQQVSKEPCHGHQ
jgi:hypothetical protein